MFVFGDVAPPNLATSSDVCKVRNDRESTSSSGIVISDKSSIDGKETKKRTYTRRVYEITRRSERIRRRKEVDVDPLPFVTVSSNSRKRKLDDCVVASGSGASSEAPELKIRKKAVIAQSRKSKRKVYR